jgi:hypothetical protein
MYQPYAKVDKVRIIMLLHNCLLICNGLSRAERRLAEVFKQKLSNGFFSRPLFCTSIMHQSLAMMTKCLAADAMPPSHGHNGDALIA